MHFRALVAVLLLLACCTAPALAAVKYTDGSPELSALVTGSNEFSPGQEATVTIIIQNSGLVGFKFVNSGTIERDDLPNTAKLVTAQLLPGSAPLTIKTDPQNVGDITGGSTVEVPVTVRIANDAAAGEYQLPLLVRYRYLETTEQEGSDQMQFIYADVNETLPLTITIRPHVRITVLSSTAGSLSIGTEGYLNLTVRNDGSEDGKKATVQVTRSGSSPVIPTDSSVFVGDFPSGGVVACMYKVAVSNDADAQTYPVDVSVTYEDREGSVITSDTVTIGVPVGGKAGFAITSDPPAIAAGQTRVITVEYRNTGSTTVYHAQTRISAVPPVSSDDDTAYLGTLQPGETAVARFAISALSDAEPGTITLNSEVRYKDALANSQISDTIKVPVTILPPSGGITLPGMATLVLIAAGLLCAGYYLLVMRKKK